MNSNNSTSQPVRPIQPVGSGAWTQDEDARLKEAMNGKDVAAVIWKDIGVLVRTRSGGKIISI